VTIKAIGGFGLLGGLTSAKSAGSANSPRRPWAAMTPTTDTNRPGRRCTQVDAESPPCQAMDGAGHFGHALQAGGQP
jgi:hypothetical protein